MSSFCGREITTTGRGSARLVLLFCALILIPAEAQKVLNVFLDERSNFTVPVRNAAIGIETLNHEIDGGLDAQMIFGESFEELPLSSNSTSSSRKCDCCYAHGCACCYDRPVSDAGFIGCFARLPAGADLPDVSLMWAPYEEAKSSASFAWGTAGAFHGEKYQSVTLMEGPGPVGVANYGLNCQHGLHLEAGKLYEGYAYLRARGKDLQASIALQDWVLGGPPLAEIQQPLRAGDPWQRVPLRLAPAAAASCGAMTADAPDGSAAPSGRRGDLAACAGRLVISHSTPGATLDVDLVYLTPGAWGLEPAPRAGSLGLPARRDVARALRQQLPPGKGLVRFGGSMVWPEGYRWKQFRGPRERRQPYQAFWYAQPGATQSRGFGIFEIIDLCEAIGCEPIITFNQKESPEDMGDFVEYCWGGPETVWGAQRAADGHPAPYRANLVEIGNEAHDLGGPRDLLCPGALVPIVEAMELRAAAVGAPLFSYLVGYNVGDKDLEACAHITAGSEARAQLEACIDATAHLGDRIFQDFHVDAFADTAQRWGSTLDAFGAVAASRGSRMRAMILESNAWPSSPLDHAMARGVGHAAYCNMAQRRAGIVPVNGYANGLQAWQGMDDGPWGWNFPQGQLFILPNGTIETATYHVIKMVARSWQPRVLATGPGWSGGPTDRADAIAVCSEDGATVVVRVANWAGAPLLFDLSLESAGARGPRVVHTVVLNGTTGEPEEQNTPGQPRAVAPRDLGVQPYVPGMRIEIPGLSFAVFTVTEGTAAGSSSNSNSAATATATA